jgi:hypothetical protein
MGFFFRFFPEGFMKYHRQLYIIFILFLLMPCSVHAYDWTTMSPVPTTNQLNAIWGSSGSDAFAVGASGTILHYDGISWTAMDSARQTILIKFGAVQETMCLQPAMPAPSCIITAARGVR